MHQEEEIDDTRKRGENRVKEVTGKEESAELNEVTKHSNLHFAGKDIRSTDFLFFNEA